jgi:hypothetical protein
MNPRTLLFVALAACATRGAFIAEGDDVKRDTDVDEPGDTDTDEPVDTDAGDTDPQVDTDTDEPVDTDAGDTDTDPPADTDTGAPVDTDEPVDTDTGPTSTPCPSGTPSIEHVQATCTSGGWTIAYELGAEPGRVTLEGHGAATWGPADADPTCCGEYVDTSSGCAASSSAYWTIRVYSTSGALAECGRFSAGAGYTWTDCGPLSTSAPTCVP